MLVHAGVALLRQREPGLLEAKSVAEVRAVLGVSERAPSTASESGNPTSPGTKPAAVVDKGPKVVGGDGADERWIKAVREAGKAGKA